jgi:predicted GNAT family acetyltransferase
MEIKQHDHESKGRFFIEFEGREIASMHYVYAGSTQLIIDHTEVSVDYEGRGLGKQLVNAGVIFARERSIHIIPLCPFAKGVFDKIEAYRDVLA